MAHPQVVYRVKHLPESHRLPQDAMDFILSADTVFVASIYKSQMGKFPSHAGMNARSGLPGFMRVRPSDGRTIVIPDYSGNRFVSSLGNIEMTPLAGLTIVSFTTGDVLYLTGTAYSLVGQDALDIMNNHSVITLVKVTGFTFVKDALPLRQQPGTPVEPSPYSPKIKYLVEETGAQSKTERRQAELKAATQLSHDIAVFRFAALGKLKIQPGQAIILNFMDWIGPPQYQHMSDSKPSLLNDDRVRTWTVSRANEDDSWFELTMREIPGGAVTGALFDVMRRSTEKKAPVVDILGITGDFRPSLNALWVAGGIGITPFLSMLNALVERPAESHITLALSTKEPQVMLELLRRLLDQLPLDIRITIDIFTHVDVSLNLPKGVSIRRGRIPTQYWFDTVGNKDALICGPKGFSDSAMQGLQAAGLSLQKIQQESFY